MSALRQPIQQRPTRRASRFRWLPALAALLVVAASTTAGLVVISAGPAAAHTDLLQASPGPGQRAGGEIRFIDLVFTEPVTEATVSVTSGGTELPGRMTATDGIIIRFELDEPITDVGRYEVEYRMISFDLDNTIDGFFFEYDPAAPEPLRLGVEIEPEGTNWVVVAASAVLMAAVAGLLFLFVKRTDARRRVESGDDVGAG